MILYYALGGGLGHISRSLALMEHAPADIKTRVRLLVSSRSAAIARSASPCPMDVVPDEAMATRPDYIRYLHDYIECHRFSCMVTDTFPFGLVGEFARGGKVLPRVLVARYLNWDAYRKRVRVPDDAPWPEASVLIEEQPEGYGGLLHARTKAVMAEGPISLWRPAADPGAADGEDNARMASTSRTPGCCIVHSGSYEELAVLRATASAVMAEEGLHGQPVVYSPASGIFPVEHHLERFSHVVAGAGYASCAAAAILQGRVTCHLHPFPRRFDDQELRLRRLREGSWAGGDPAGGSARVARVVWEEVHTLS